MGKFFRWVVHESHSDPYHFMNVALAFLIASISVSLVVYTFMYINVQKECDAILDSMYAQQPAHVSAAKEYDIDQDLSLLVSRAATSNNIPTDVAYALVFYESSFDHTALSWAGAIGLTQIMPITARHMGVRYLDLYDPELNLNTGFAYLSELIDRFGDTHTALVAYHVGPTNVGKYGPGAFSVSVEYADKIMGED